MEASVMVFVTWTLLVVAAYGMYAVAYVFERRTPSWAVLGRDYVPVWRGQSKAFFPGDAGLALAVAVARPSWPQHWSAYCLAVVVCAAAHYGLRRVTYREEDYTPAEWRSPSKRYHDYVVAYCFATFAVLFWWAAIERGGIEWWQYLLLGVGLLIWLVGLAYDAIRREVPNRFQHPDSWRPLWAK